MEHYSMFVLHRFVTELIIEQVLIHQIFKLRNQSMNQTNTQYLLDQVTNVI